jgi:hypothetical protein
MVVLPQLRRSGDAAHDRVVGAGSAPEGRADACREQHPRHDQVLRWIARTGGAEVDHASQAPVPGDEVAGHHVRVYPGLRPVPGRQPGSVEQGRLGQVTFDGSTAPVGTALVASGLRRGSPPATSGDVDLASMQLRRLHRNPRSLVARPSKVYQEDGQGKSHLSRHRDHWSRGQPSCREPGQNRPCAARAQSQPRALPQWARKMIGDLGHHEIANQGSR